MFKEIHYYKPNLEDVIRRYRALYDAKEPGHAMIYAMPPAPVAEPVPALNKIDLNTQMEAYLDICLRNYALALENTVDICDDLIPTFGPNFGIGDYSAFIAGEVVFTEDTSWAAPVMKSLDDYKEFTLREDAYWVRMLERALLYLARQTASGPIPIIRGFYSPLDLAHSLRGEALFTDFTDEPQKVHQFMDFCADAIIWIASRLRRITGENFEGNIAGAWLRPGTICMSEDIACLISPRTYAEFARPYTQKVINAFGYGQIHTHSLGIRCIPEITKLERLLGVQISDDPNIPRGFDKLEWLLPRVNGIPLTVGCTPAELVENYDLITAQCNIQFASVVADAKEGKELVEWFRRKAG
ncbi:MAG: hypothetical protein KBF64_00400 [Anaerolineaceae bacterium]|nr:hypothetical protein [Anaerolineaceae bacterium]